MRFLGRAFLGLFIASIAFAFLALALNAVRGAVVARMDEQPRNRPSREQSYAVDVVAYAPETIAPTLQAFGTIKSGRTLELRINKGGQINFVSDSFVEGGHAQAGEILITTDDSDEQTLLDRAGLELDVATANVATAQDAVTFAARDVNLAQEQVAVQTAALLRKQDLVTRGVGTEASIEAAQSAVTSAQQAILAKERALAQANSDLVQRRNALNLAKLAQDEAARGLNDTRLVAGFDGVLSGISAVSGGLVNQNEKVGALIDPSRLEVEFRVSTAQYALLVDDNGALIQSDLRVVMELQDFRAEVAGQITRESALVSDGQTGRLLFARLDGAGIGQLRSGDFVTVEINEPALDRVARLPAAAVDTGGNVLVVGAENRLEEMPVTVLRRQGNDVLVRGRNLRDRQIVAQRTPVLGAGILVTPRSPTASTDPLPEAAPDIALTDERRQKLIAAVQANGRMPKDVKDRMLNALQQPTVPARMIERLEARIGRGG